MLPPWILVYGTVEKEKVVTRPKLFAPPFKARKRLDGRSHLR